MVHKLGRLIQQGIRAMGAYLRLFLRRHKYSIDLRDIFPTDVEDLFGPEAEEEFRAFSSPDEYNREILYLFQTHSESFHLDRTHMDGHFRV